MEPEVSTPTSRISDSQILGREIGRYVDLVVQVGSDLHAFAFRVGKAVSKVILAGIDAPGRCVCV